MNPKKNSMGSLQILDQCSEAIHNNTPKWLPEELATSQLPMTFPSLLVILGLQQDTTL